MQSSYYSCQILERLQFYGEIFQKHSKSIHENPTSWSLVFQCGRMDRQTDVAKSLVALSSYVTLA